MDPMTFRGVERILIALGGVFFGYLGYCLFKSGLTVGEGNLKLESKTLKLLFTGTGPGLFFMAFGAIVLVVCIIKGGVTKEETITSAITEMKDSARQSRTELSEVRETVQKLREESALQRKISTLETVMMKAGSSAEMKGELDKVKQSVEALNKENEALSRQLKEARVMEKSRAKEPLQ